VIAVHSEIAFTLPVGYVDERGETHRRGTMRLATARDEIEPLQDTAVRDNTAYLTVLLLARTVTSIGPVTDITPGLVEQLYAADFDHLQRIYERVNSGGESIGVVSCPHCAERFEVDLTEVDDERLAE
jgi:hypothetical protein